MKLEKAIAAAFTREWLLTGVTLGLIAALAWAYLGALALRMEPMGPGMGMPLWRPWGPAEALLTLAMWIAMMVAMNVPAAAPMILLFATIHQRRRPQGSAVPTGIFLSGYLLIWSGFSVLATALQYGLHRAALLSADAASGSHLFGGALLVIAGIYQLTPAKGACLARCRSPFDFITGEWREGKRGALVMGVRHGLYCTGCCWALMLLLFVGGVMNLLWVAAIALFTLGEKWPRPGLRLAPVAGLLLSAWGLWLLAGGSG